MALSPSEHGVYLWSLEAYKIREMETKGRDDDPRSLSDLVQSGLGPKRKKTEPGLAEDGGGSGSVPWVGNGGGAAAALPSMREFFEAGGRSYEAYLEVCKDRRDKIVSKTKEDHVIMSSQLMTQFTRSVTADNYGNSPKFRSNRTERSQAAKSAGATFDFSSADDRSPKMTSPEASVPTTSGRSSSAGIATSGQCLTSEIIDKVIAVGLKTPLSELPRFSVSCRPLANNAAAAAAPQFPVISFTAAPHSASPPSYGFAQPIYPAGSPVFSGVCPPVNFSPSIAPPPPISPAGSPVFSGSCPPVNLSPSIAPPLGANCAYDGASFFGFPSICVPGKRSHPYCEGAVDLSCKRQKPAEPSEAGNQTMTSPEDSVVQSELEEDDDSASAAASASRSGSAPRVTSSAQSATIFSDVTRWSVEQVVRYVAGIPGCRDYAETFRQEQIDGACLIRLTERHLLDVVKMKLGPAIRLLQAISSLCMNYASSEIPSSS